MPPNSPKAKKTAKAVSLEIEVQQVLDELWSEKAIPFALSVGKLTKGIGEYTIFFHDSRIRSARILLTEHSSFKDMVRTSVLARVAQMSGPLPVSPSKK